MPIKLRLPRRLGLLHAGLCFSLLISPAWAFQEEQRQTSADDPINTEQTREQTELIKAQCLGNLKKLFNEFPEDPESHLLMSRYFARHGDGDQAMTYLESARELAPQNPEVYIGMGWVEWKRRSGEPASKSWSRAIELNPSLPNIRNYLGRVLLSLGQREEAIAVLRKEVELFPQAFESHFLLGQIHQQNQEYLEAKEAYEAALDLNPQFANATYCLSAIYARLGDTDKAKEFRLKFRAQKENYDRDFDSSILSFDDLNSVAEVLSDLSRKAAMIYVSASRLDQAVELWKSAASMDPKDAISRMRLAEVYARNKDPENAIRMYEQLIEIDPTKTQNHLRLGALFAGLKRFEDAEKRFRTVCELQPGSPVGYRSLAQLYLQNRKKLPQALDYAQSCANLAPTAPHYYLLGVAFASNGDTNTAVSNFEKAVELDPQNATYRQALEQLKRRN